MISFLGHFFSPSCVFFGGGGCNSLSSLFPSVFLFCHSSYIPTVPHFFHIHTVILVLFFQIFTVLRFLYLSLSIPLIFPLPIFCPPVGLLSVPMMNWDIRSWLPAFVTPACWLSFSFLFFSPFFLPISHAASPFPKPPECIKTLCLFYLYVNAPSHRSPLSLFSAPLFTLTSYLWKVMQEMHTIV